MNLIELWSFKDDDPILGIEIKDINGNDQAEIIAYTKKGKILVISIEGKLLNEQQITENSSIWCVKIADLSKDGKNEIILGGLDGLLRVFSCTKSYSLEPIWAHQFGASIGGILLEDLNIDGFQEIVAYSLDNSIRVLNHKDGSLLWGQVFEDGIGDAVIWVNDKERAKKEVIACGNDGTVRVFNGTNGELLWHQRFSDKIRCIARLNSVKGPIISCGGDDRLLHLIDKNAKKEIEFLEFEDYVWKALSFPYAQYEKIIVSTYSFAYFNESLPIDKIDFSSKIVCIDKNLEVSWEICGKNAEYLNAFEKNGRSIALIGTTSGEILMIDSNTGKILLENKKNACINMVQGLSNKNLIVSCNDDGQIIAYLIEII